MAPRIPVRFCAAQTEAVGTTRLYKQTAEAGDAGTTESCNAQQWSSLGADEATRVSGDRNEGAAMVIKTKELLLRAYEQDLEPEVNKNSGDQVVLKKI